jgi:hypothetical protein
MTPEQLSALNRRLLAHDLVREMNFSSEPPLGEPKLVLRLENKNGDLLNIIFLGVVALTFNQSMQVWLKVTDISANQLDRIAYQVKDFEYGNLKFMCRAIEVVDN